MSNLLGRVKFQLLIDEAEVAQIGRAISTAIAKPAPVIVDRLAKVGVNYLRRLDQEIGHLYLAGKWTHTPPARTAEGVTSEIYSAAEDELFKHDTKRATYIIRGRDLLRILEAGAKPHLIAPKLTEHLVFASTMGWHRSIFGGTLRGGINAFLGGKAKYGVGALIFRREPEDMLFLDRVRHPGVSGNRFVQMTKALLEERMALEARELLSRVEIVPGVH